MPLFIIFCLFTALAHSFNTSTLRLLTPALASNTTSPAFLHHAFTSNATIFAPLAAPLYRNVTAGDAWVFPSSANDLGARDMSCECFNPGDQCCMPTSPSVGPFCMPTGSTCCGDTFCVVGETCCGEYCCAPNNICNLKAAGSGCCPTGNICSGPAICYDHASSNCSNQAVPPQLCCPTDIPFCRDFKPAGWGCYASSTTASSTSSVPTMTAAGTSNLFTAFGGTSTSTAARVTRTISVVSKGDGGFSLEFPTGSASGGLMGGSTTYVLEWPATSATAAVAARSSSKSDETTKTTVSSTAATTSIPSTTAQSIVASSSAGSSTISPLCYDPAANSHSRCPTTTPSPASSSSSNALFSPSGATIVKSQASKLRIPFLDPLRNFVTSQRGNSTLIYLLATYIAYECLRLLRIAGATWRNEASSPTAPHPSTIHNAILPTLAMLALAFLSRSPLHPYPAWEPFCALTIPIPILILSAFETAAGLLHKANPDRLAAQRNMHIVRAALRQCGYADAQIDTILAGPPRMRDEVGSLDGIVPPAGSGKEKERQDIVVVKGSARPLLPPRVVRKGEITLVQGSARPFVKGKRTHSLWEGMGHGSSRADTESSRLESREGGGRGGGEFAVGYWEWGGGWWDGRWGRVGTCLCGEEGEGLNVARWPWVGLLV